MNPQLMRSMSYGVYITTSCYGTKASGCVTNSNTQITSSPATISVSVNHNNYTNELIRKSGKFGFTILSEQSAPGLIGHFGFSSGRDTNKFEKLDAPVRWMHGLPVVMTGCGYGVCRVVGTMETSTHTIFLGELIEAEVLSSEVPMTYRYYHQVIRGKSPKNAPTYIAPTQETPSAPEATGTRWVCGVCGYIYEGETLPEGYTCPICGKPASVFTRMPEGQGKA